MLEKLSQLPTGETPLTLEGIVGNIEAVFLKPDNMRSDVVAVVCHPHPLHGGTMNNKVVTTVARALKELNIGSLRFNFRGVGRSAGTFDHGIGETADLLLLLNWLQKASDHAAIILTGFSFGSFVAYRASSQFPIRYLVCIAPAVNHVDYTVLAEPSCPWLIVQGEEDEVVPAEQVFAWVKTLKTKPQLIRMPGVSHFFHGSLVQLRQQLSTVLSQDLSSIILKDS